MRKLILFLALMSLNFVHSQVKLTKDNNDIKLAALPYYSYGKGLGITSADSIFQLNIRFRMQNRISYYDYEDGEAAYEGVIRRLRLRFDGYVGDPKFIYAIQLSFAPNDVGVVEKGDNINIIRDAMFFYRPNAHWNFGMGQTKLPGNRQRVNSSGALQLTDRSINNAKFNIDRDFGLQAYYLQEHLDQFSYTVKTAISTGEGRNYTKSKDDGLAFTGKVEVFPFGAFKKNGTTFEGSIIPEEDFKLMVSAAFSQNNHTHRTAGQTGLDLFAKRSMKSTFLDAMMKYKQWAFMTAFMNRTATDPITYNPTDPTDKRYVFTGHGMDYQLSYTFPTAYEIIGRYSNQKVHADLKDLEPNTQQYTLGMTKYFWEHAFKMQGEVSYDATKTFEGVRNNAWYVRFQIEIGI